MSTSRYKDKSTRSNGKKSKSIVKTKKDNKQQVLSPEEELDKLRKENEELMQKMIELKTNTEKQRKLIEQKKGAHIKSETEKQAKLKKAELEMIANKVRHHQRKNDQAARKINLVKKDTTKLKEVKNFSRNLSEIKREKEEIQLKRRELNKERALSVKQARIKTAQKVEIFNQSKISLGKKTKMEEEDLKLSLRTL